MLALNRRKFLTWMGLSWLASALPSTIGAAIVQAQSRSSVKSVVFYVAPNGNDAWSGTQATPNAAPNGPFATLQRARDAVRALKRQQGGSLEQPVTIYVRNGTYFLTGPLALTSEDSGTANFPIVYAAYKDETPVISGGQRLTGWQPVTINGKQLFRTTISSVQNGKWFFRQIWVNGQRRDRARHPNKGYLKIAEVPDATPETIWSQGQNRFRFQDGDLEEWQTVKDAEVVVMTNWLSSRLPVTEIDEKQRLISFRKTSDHKMKPGDLYYIENALEILDIPGEWYLARTGQIYYMPMPGEDLEAEVIAGVWPRIIRLTGNPAADQFVEYVEFRGLAFAHSESNFPDKSKYSSASQGARAIPGAVYLKGVRNCTFLKCFLTYLGTYAVELAEGCQHNRVTNCEMTDLGAGGVKIRPEIREKKAEQTYSNEITNCHIHNLGNLYKEAVGIWIGQSYDNRVDQNYIHDCYFVGISVGETWGYERSLAKNNTVEFNHIHHVGLRSDGDGPLLNDKGAIYSLGVQPGTVIRSNLIHDIDAFNYGGWGIYLDAGSSQIVVENNLVYRTRDGGFHLHYGKENVVQNNIFAFGKLAQIRRSVRDPHLSFTFERNIVYWSNGKLLEGKWDNFNFAFDYNLYWQVGGGEIRFVGFSWEEWQAKGMDEHSIIAEPLFIAPEAGDFRLKPNSPAFELGFQLIPPMKYSSTTPSSEV